MKGKKKIKEKRYFFEWWKKSDGIIAGIIVFSLFLIVGIGTFVGYNNAIKHYNNEINSYSESDYIYLDKLAEDIIKEDVGIDFTLLPKEVKYKCINEDERISIELSLDNKERKISEGTKLDLELSKDFKLISKNRNYSSEKYFVKCVKDDIRIMSIFTTVIVWLILLIVTIFVMNIAINISKNNMEKDKKNT